jgi:phosphonate transport system substrate-binding protein
MRAYLGRELGRPVQVSTAPSWSAFHQRTLALEYDLVVTGAHLARIAQIDRGYTPLLCYVPDTRALLVVAASRPLRDINELRGQALVLANPQSLVAMHGLQWLTGFGLRRGRDFDVIETPTDDSVGNVVVRGDAAAAMLSAGELRAVPEATRAQLVVLASIAEVPGFVVLASPRLAPETARSLRELLLHFARESEEGKSFFASTGLTSIREIPPGLMESLDPYVEPTRKAFAPG